MVAVGKNAIDVLDEDGTTKIGVIKDAYNIVGNEQIITRVRGLETLEFNLPLESEDVTLLSPERRIHFWANGRTYIIITIEQTKAAEKTVHVYCEALWYELADGEYFFWENRTKTQIQNAFGQVLVTTGWDVGTYPNVPTRIFTIRDETRLWSLRYLAQVYGVEMSFDTTKKLVNLKDTPTSVSEFRGYNTVFRYDYTGANISSITRTIDTSQLVTRVYMYGEDGLTVESINDGFPYINNYGWYYDIGKTPKIKTHVIEDDRFTDVDSMYAYMLDYLDTYAYPIITYTVDEAVVGNIDLGDYAYVQDWDLGLKIWTRCLEKTTNYSNPSESKVVFDAFTNDLSSSSI